MPGSWGIFDDVVEAIVSTINPARFMDIGTGSGKYGAMVRHAAPNCHTVGVEVEASYIEQFKLRELYDEMRNIDVAQLMRNEQEDLFDLVIIGDCIEHLPKSLGIDLLNFLTYRTRYIVVLAPEFCVQGATGGVGSESHVSVWSEHDFHWHDAWAYDNALTVGLYVLRGYQPSELPLTALIETINRRQVRVMDFNRENYIRPAHLIPQIRLRSETINGQNTSFRMK